MLIACANVAHLLLGQAATRQAEISMRYALGADRSRIVRQLLIETLTIAVPGGIAGLAIAVAGVRALVLVAPRNLPRLAEITVDPTVLLFTLAMTLLTAIVFGLGPAMQTARTSANDLGRIGQRVAGHRGVRRGHQALVVGELALAQALLVGAGLLLVSFVHATRIDLGFAQHDRVLAEVNLTPAYLQPIGNDGHIDPSKKIRFINAVLDRVRGGPGVRAVAASSTAPLTGAPNRGMRIEGDPVLPPDQQPNADFQLITPDYFRALGITLVAGRAFDASDRADTPPVLVVNQALADKYFGGRNPIGRVILFGGSKRHEIVGIVANARYRTVEQPADPTFYLPLEQNDERWPFLAFTVWTDGSAAATTGASALIRSAVRDADPQQPVSRLRTIEEILVRLAGGAPIQHVDRDAVRRDGPAARGDRHLRRDGVRRHQPHARARRPRGARRHAGRSDSIGAWPGTAADADCERNRSRRGDRIDALHGVTALQRRAARSRYVRARRRRARACRDRRHADSRRDGAMQVSPTVTVLTAQASGDLRTSNSTEIFSAKPGERTARLGLQVLRRRTSG